MPPIIKLSYIIATRNRLPFLKITLEKLLSEIKENEEIVVVDGNSTDGAKEYLQQLFDEGGIQQFISEPDRNQAHGWNKAMLMARGVIIKKIIDDDVYNFAAIRKCSDFMLANTGVDVCISNCMEGDLSNPGKVNLIGRLLYYQAWKARQTNTFTFGDVSLLIRRTSLSFIGLYDLQFTMMDWEYSLRCSYLKANIAYYTGYNALSVGTPGNVTSSASKKTLKQEALLGNKKYDYPGDGSDISFYSRIKIGIGKAYFSLLGKKRFIGLLKMPSETELRQYYSNYYKLLADQNQANNFEFIF